MSRQPPSPLVPPAPERCHDPLYVDASGHLVDDPFERLGLDPESAPDEEAIRAAWAEQLIAHPPESDPEGARALREARDRLIDPARLFERTLGVLHVPAHDAWSLPGEADVLAALDEAPDMSGLIDARARLLGQAVLYALVEDTLNTLADDDG